ISSGMTFGFTALIPRASWSRSCAGPARRWFSSSQQAGWRISAGCCRKIWSFSPVAAQAGSPPVSCDHGPLICQRRSLRESILAEIELLSAFAAEWILQKLLVPLWAQVITKLFVRFRQFHRRFVVVHVAQHLTDRFHVVLFEVRFGNLCGVVGGIGLDLDHVAMVVS